MFFCPDELDHFNHNNPGSRQILVSHIAKANTEQEDNEFNNISQHIQDIQTRWPWLQQKSNMKAFISFIQNLMIQKIERITNYKYDIIKQTTNIGEVLDTISEIGNMTESSEDSLSYFLENLDEKYNNLNRLANPQSFIDLVSIVQEKTIKYIQEEEELITRELAYIKQSWPELTKKKNNAILQLISQTIINSFKRTTKPIDAIIFLAAIWATEVDVARGVPRKDPNPILVKHQ